MKHETSKKIISYLKKNKQASGAKLADFLDISDRAVRKQLKGLLEKGIIYKVGKPPKVFYLIKKAEKEKDFTIDKRHREIIEENYLIITPSGKKKAAENKEM